jgi:hypothetical protein
MRTPFSRGIVAGLLAVAMASAAPAGINFNLSKSNVNRLVYPSDAMSPAQAAAIVADLDKAGRLDEARATQLVQQLLVKHGVKPGTIKKITVRPWEPVRKSASIIVLTDPADEAQAIAVSDEGAPGSTPAKTTKSAR